MDGSFPPCRPYKNITGIGNINSYEISLDRGGTCTVRRVLIADNFLVAEMVEATGNWNPRGAVWHLLSINDIGLIAVTQLYMFEV